jgi:HlyD family secretion protein
MRLHRPLGLARRLLNAGMDIARPDLKLARRRKHWLAGGVGVVVLALGGLALATLEPAAPKVDRASVWIDTVKRGEMLREVRGPGTLVPKEIRWIAAETSARVERVVIKPGATVEAGSVILELSNPEVVDQHLAAQAALTAALADLTAKRVELENQSLDLEASIAVIEADHQSALLRAEAEGEMNRRGVVSTLQYKQTELTAQQLGTRLAIERQRAAKFRQNIAAQLAAEDARIEQLKNTLSLRQRQADALSVRAGIAGVLQQVPVEEGQQVLAGTNLARVARPDVLMAELRIAETQAKDVLVGQPVRIDTRNGIVAGTVTRIDPAVISGTVQVDVDFNDGMPAGARPDLSVDGTIEIERLVDVLYVGRPAFGQPETQSTLFRLDPDGDIARRVPVSLGRASVSVIEVRSGLQVGDRVLLADTSEWDRHDRIRLE